MRLLKTDSLQFKHFPDSDVPRYAILSHRWGEEEVTFGDMNSLDSARKMKGYKKLERFCDMARSQKYDYAWMDTCCINKSNFAELGEAINSMYRWYSDATVCFAYLEDVGPGRKSMEESVWFERGWTLQELIAPTDVFFYDHKWTSLGAKRDHVTILQTITGIPIGVLSGATKPTSCSTAQRMSWAAKRVTERIEDRAYSLIGLFGVSLPMIYGERDKAFIRLQEEIIAKSDDESIFAWSPRNINHSVGYSGLLAPSPDLFAGCSQVVSIPGSLGFSIKNTGLSIQLPTSPFSMESYLAYLNCTHQSTSSTRYAILITRMSTVDQYCRVMDRQTISGMLCPMPRSSIIREVRVRQDPTEPPLNIAYGFWLRTLQPPGHIDCDIKILSRVKSSETDHVYCAPGRNGTMGIVSMKPVGNTKSGWSRIRWMKFGFDSEFNPVCLLGNADLLSSVAKPNIKAIEEAISGHLDAKACEALFDSEWTLEYHPAPIAAHGWPSGICTPRGNRKTGLAVKLLGLNLQIVVKLVPDHSPTARNAGRLSKDRKIWMVDITEVDGPSPESESRKQDLHNCCCCVVRILAS